MGVGAIFISTLAKNRLPEPTSPPETPQDILATALHPVVGFVVLVSIIVRKLAYPCYIVTLCMKESCVDGLSIALFTAGKHMHNQTRQSTNAFRGRVRTNDSLAILTSSGEGASAVAQSQLGSAKRQSMVPEITSSGPDLLSPNGLIGGAGADSSASTKALVAELPGPQDRSSVVHDNYGIVDEAVGRLSMEIVTTTWPNVTQ
jgi:hypothetical protein